MISIISRSNIDRFEEVAPALERALEKTALSDTWNLRALYDHVVNKEAYVFLQDESGYAGVIQFVNTPLQRVLYFFWSGKDRSNRVLVDYDEVDSFLEAVAKDQGCASIMCEGRKGWKPMLTKRGYSEDSVIFTKEVKLNELPTV